MRFEFRKYHGTGNDFVMIDNRKGSFSGNEHKLFAQMCHRRFGIGADGLILLNNHPDYDFEMYYVNADGHPTSMCGNGGRCVVRFAETLGMIGQECQFMAIDGLHEAQITDFGVKLKMGLPHGFQRLKNGDFWIDTGSPHYVTFVEDDLESLDVFTRGKAIRNSDTYREAGTNVNFVQEKEGLLHVRTYERGVEDETWACGTGVTAVAEVWSRIHTQKEGLIELKQPGGILRVEIKEGEEPWLEGPAVEVFRGTWG